LPKIKFHEIIKTINVSHGKITVRFLFTEMQKDVVEYCFVVWDSKIGLMMFHCTVVADFTVFFDSGYDILPKHQMFEFLA
jgi:hypothetical protein